MKTKRLLMAMVLFAQALYAAQWLDPETGIFWQYTFGGNGDEAWIGNCNNDPTKWLYAAYPLPQGDIEIPTELGGVLVKGIGHYAFNNCSNLTSVTIRPGVDNIRDVAFYNCEKLKSVTIPEGVTNIGERAFEYCTNLTSVTIPSSVSRIKMETFHNCFGLKSATISEGVTSIEPRAFCCCEGLVSLLIPSSMKSIGWMAFFDCQSLRSLTIPEGVTNVGESAFSNCYGLESVSIPESLANIGSGAFAGCRALAKIYVAKGDEVRVKEMLAASGLNVDELTFVEMAADGGSYKETIDGIEWTYTVRNGNGSVVSISAATIGAITIPSILGGHPVTRIGAYAFSGCSGLTSVTIPSGVTSIGESAFAGCTGLRAVNIDDLAKWCEIEFDGWHGTNPLEYAKKLYLHGKEVIHLDIPNGVDAIGRLAFQYCSGLMSVTIPPSVTRIGEYAFYGTKFWNDHENGLVVVDNCLIGCKEPSPREVVIPNGVRVIANFAFYGCSGLTSVTIPSSVTSIGQDAFQYCSGLTSVTIPACVSKLSATFPNSYTTIEKVIVCEGVTSIGDYAFYDCSGLTSVTIPLSVTSIGGSAFSGCDELTSVTIPSSVTPLSNTFPSAYTKIREVVVLDGVTSIGQCAFCGCRGLTSVTIPSSVTRIGADAFWDCTGLTAVNIGDLAKWCEIAFDGDWANPMHYAKKLYLGGKEIVQLSIPAGVPKIGAYAFYNCERFLSVTIPLSVTSIGERAFWGCAGLTSVTIPPSVTSIGSSAFSGCSRLSSAAIPSKVTSIEWDTFSGCSGLTSVTIPPSVTSIGGSAFSGCSGLTSVTIPPSVTSIGDSAFRGCTQITEIEIPEGVGELPDSLFAGCAGLASVVIPNSVSNISGTAFKDCGNVISVTMPGRFAMKDVFPSSCGKIQNVTILNGEKNLSNAVFAGCSALTAVVISEGVATLGEDLLYGFTNLRELTIPSTVTSIGGYALNGCSALKTIHVSGNGDVDMLKQMLYESGFDTTGVTFDRIVYCKVKFDPQGGVAEWTEAEVREGMAVGGLPAVTCDGYEFLGWFTAASGGTKVTAATVVTENMTLYAHWTKSGEESVEPVKPPVDPPSTDPAIVCNIKAEYRTKTDIGVIPVEVVNVGEEVKIAVKGLPGGVKFTAKDIVDKKTKAVTVPANSIYGTPTKSGVYAATVTVTPTNKKLKMTTLVKTLTFVVRNAGEHIVRADCDAAQGSVKGMGVYAKGKKVTLKATAAKGWVFSGWYDGDALVSRLASYVLTMPNKDVKVSARFVTAAADKKSIALAVTAGGRNIVQTKSITVKQGIYVEWPVVASALSATTVKVSGLPSGLKFTAKDVKATKTSAAVPANTIYGTPKTASKTDKNGNVTPSKVKITVTTAGKAKQEYVINVTVRGIPAEGTFNGGSASGLVTLTVAKTGKISGKYLADGKTWTLSAAGFDSWDDHDRLTATLTAKSGKEVKTVALVYEDGRVCASLTSGQETPRIAPPSELASLGGYASPLFEAWRNEWKTEPQKSLAAKLKGQKVTVGENGNIVLTVGASGAVTAKGTFGTYSASCSTVLIPTESKGTYVVYLYFPPKAGKFDGWVGTAYITAE